MRGNDDIDALETLRAARMAGRRTGAAFTRASESFFAVGLAECYLVRSVPMVAMARPGRHSNSNKTTSSNR